MSVIFLAGVHGVGKGYLGTRVAAALGMVHCTASQLIREEKGRENWGVDKVVSDVDENQKALAAALERLRTTGVRVLLDGHFVLRTPNETFVRLDLEVFRGLCLAGVVLLVDDATTIATRLALRDGVSRTPESIKLLAVEEAEHAGFVTDALGLPFIVLSAPTEDSLVDAILQI